MIPITSFHVFVSYPNPLIHWEYLDIDLSQFKFYLLRFINRYELDKEIEFNPQEYNQILDTEIDFRSYKSSVIKYQLKITQGTDIFYYPEQPLGIDLWQDPLALYLLDTYRLYLNYFTYKLIFPVKTNGTRCSCYDPVLKKRTKTHCDLCYDTGYLGGYYRPIKTRIGLSKESVQFTASPLNTQEKQRTTSFLITSTFSISSYSILLNSSFT